jgi:hypothetical protein
MRRVAIVWVLLGAVSVAAGPAGAHSCASPVAVEVGRRASVPVGIAAEQAPVTGVEVTVPKGFRLARVRPPGGWRATAEATVVELQGGTIEPFGCAIATLEGTATDAGELAFRVTAIAGDGSREVSLQSVFAEGRSSDSSPSPLGAALGIGLVVLGATGAGVVFLRRRRAQAGRRAATSQADPVSTTPSGPS